MTAERSAEEEQAIQGFAQILVRLAQRKVAQRRYQTVTCTVCGALRARSIPKEERATYVCRSCQPRALNMTCRFCGKPSAKPYCDADCYGGQSQAAALLGVSRERMRQLVEEHRAKAGGTRQEAVQAVIKERSTT